MTFRLTKLWLQLAERLLLDAMLEENGMQIWLAEIDQLGESDHKMLVAEASDRKQWV